MKENQVPVVHAARRVPISVKNKLKKTLDAMENEKIITPISTPTDWVSSMVVVEKKDGSLRICLDPKDLNASIKRSHYQIPVLDEVTSQLNGAKIFSTFDAKNGYWQVPLSESASELTTFNTPFGRYKWLRLPFGLNIASEEF